MPSQKVNRMNGWLIDYAVGLLFTELYLRFWKNSSSNTEEKAGLVFGGLAGLAALLIWRFTISVHPYPPPINFGLFSLKLHSVIRTLR